MNFRVLFVSAALVGVGGFVAIQLVPFGRDHVNPPVTKSVTWSSPEAKQIAVRACYDCHSNETVWPWYSNVAPISWLVYRDTMEGRRHLNFSRWDKAQKGSATITASVEKGKMPFWPYLLAHPAARLTKEEKVFFMKALDEVEASAPDEDEVPSPTPEAKAP